MCTKLTKSWICALAPECSKWFAITGALNGDAECTAQTAFHPLLTPKPHQREDDRESLLHGFPKRRK